MGSNVVLAARFSFRRPPGAPESCDGSLACQLADLVPELAVFAVFFGLFVGLATILHLTDAESAVVTERAQTAWERDAFEEFADRVAALDAPAQTSRQTAPATTLTTGQFNTSAEAVKDAYRDTVMEQPGYDDVYGESLETNMAAELGGDVTQAVLKRGSFTQPLQRALVAKARTAAQQREAFDRTLAQEADAITTADETYSNVLQEVDALDDRPLPEQDYDDLTEAWHCIRRLERECKATLTERQEQIHDTAVDPPSGGARGTTATVLPVYLYRSLDVTFPVLADGTTVLQTLQQARTRAFSALAVR